MKNIKNAALIAIFSILFFINAAFAQSSRNQQVLERQKEFAAAILASDWKKLATFCHEDLIYTHSFGRVDTKSDFLTNIAKLKVEQWENQMPTVKIYKNTAVVHSNLLVKLVRPNGEMQSSQQRAMDVWIREKKSWLLVVHQSTSFQ